MGGGDGFCVLIQVTEEKQDTGQITARDFSWSFAGHLILLTMPLVTEKLIF